MPTRRLLAVFGLLVGVAAVSVLVPELRWIVLAADVLALAAFAIDWSAAKSSRLAARRRWPPLLVQGQQAEITVEVAAPQGESHRSVALREGLHPALAASPLRQTIETSAENVALWSYCVDPRRRGEVRILPLMARVEGPWGLAWAERELLPPESRRVYPQVRWEGRAGRLLALAHRRQLGLAPTRLTGIGSEPYGVRRYAEGDAPNRIHWKATARHGHLMTREETWEKSGRLVILLDCGRAMASLDGSRSKLDAALAAALALTRVASARGDQVLLVAFSDRIERRVRVRPGAGGIGRAYAALYDLEARLAESAYDLAAEAVRGAEFRRSRVVLMTSLVDLASAELLREALLVLRRHHRPLLVHMEDPDIARLAFASPATAVEAYGKASAIEILLGNRRLSTSLRHSGIEALSTSADRLTLDTLDGYLRALREQGRASRGSGAPRTAPRPDAEKVRATTSSR